MVSGIGVESSGLRRECGSGRDGRLDHSRALDDDGTTHIGQIYPLAETEIYCVKDIDLSTDRDYYGSLYTQ